MQVTILDEDAVSVDLSSVSGVCDFGGGHMVLSSVFGNKMLLSSSQISSKSFSSIFRNSKR